MRMILNGQHFDLLAAFNDAKLSDWKAFISGTYAHEGKARGTADVRRGINAMFAANERMRAVRDAGGVVESTPLEELQLIETVTDLLFLARRAAGERRLTYGDVADGVEYTDVIDAFAAAAEQDAAAEDGAPDVETDPTQA